MWKPTDKMKNYKEMYYNKEFENSRNYMKFQLLQQWMRLKNEKINFGDFFADRGITSIALYGIGELGRLFYDELEFWGIETILKYGIDQSSNAGYKNIPVYSLNSSLEKVDAIIISPVMITDEIEDKIYEILGEQVTFTIEEILYELSRKYQITSALWEI